MHKLTLNLDSAVLDDCISHAKNPTFDGERRQDVLTLVDSFDLQH